MLSNAYFLAKFRFDTAENEPAKNLQNFANFANPNHANARTQTGRLRSGAMKSEILPSLACSDPHYKALCLLSMTTKK